MKQLEKQLSIRRFELTYIDSKGEKQIPVVIHRAIYGTFDRFTAFYTEETKGVFPTWLAPTQVVVMPVNSEFQSDYAEEIYDELLKHDIRAELDARNEKLGYRLRESQTKKVPYTLILGDNEKNNKEISYRRFGSQETITVPKDKFIKDLVKEIKDKKVKK